MGEMADMMLDGTMCSVCGVYLGSDNDFPTMCPDCERDSRQQKGKANFTSHNKKSRKRHSNKKA